MENNQNETYYFPDQHIIVAFGVNDFGVAQASGIFLTDPDQAFTRQELLGYFHECEPAYLIAAEIPEVEGDVTETNYRSKLSDFIMDLYENSLDDLEIK